MEAERADQAEKIREVFVTLGQSLGAATAPREVALALLEAADELFGWDAGVVDVYLEGDDDLSPIVTVDLFDGQRRHVEHPSDCPKIGPLTRRALDEGPLLILRDGSETDESIYFGNHALRSASIMYVPVKNGSKIVGVMSVQSYTRRAYRPEFLELLQAVASYGGSALERAYTEAKLCNSEERLRLLVEQMPAVIWTVDRELRFTQALGSGLRALGTEPHQLLGKTLLQYFSTDDPDFAPIAAHRQAIQGQTSEFEIEWSERMLDCFVQPLRNSGGGIVGCVCVAHDITERRKAEEKLRLFAAELERTNRELQEFAYIASHDLQEPLTKIQLFMEKLKLDLGEQLPERAKDSVQRVNNAVKRMRTFIGDLLLLSRVTTKAQPFAGVDLAESVKSAFSDIGREVELSGAQILIGDMPVLDADALQMHQLFYCLLGNAVKFRDPERPLVVKVSATMLKERRSNAIAPKSDLCQISVQDNGIGFDEKYTDRIFAPFQRLHARDKYEGSGMGLAICRKIAERHGGSITVTSAPGEGSTFTVTLPAKQLAE